jgi:hypothetical protein
MNLLPHLFPLGSVAFLKKDINIGTIAFAIGRILIERVTDLPRGVYFAVFLLVVVLLAVLPL